MKYDIVIVFVLNDVLDSELGYDSFKTILVTLESYVSSFVLVLLYYYCCCFHRQVMKLSDTSLAWLTGWKWWLWWWTRSGTEIFSISFPDYLSHMLTFLLASSLVHCFFFLLSCVQHLELHATRFIGSWRKKKERNLVIFAEYHL